MVGVHVSEGKSRLKVNSNSVAVVVVAVVVVCEFAVVVGLVSRGNTPGWGTAVWTGDARATMADTTMRNNPETGNRIIKSIYDTKNRRRNECVRSECLKETDTKV